MKGRVVVIDRIDGREAAALVVDGQLDDFLIDPPDQAEPQPGSIHLAIADRPIKGQNGIIVRLSGGARGFLRQASGIAPGQSLLVQVATWAEEGKAAPVSTRLLFKGRYAILTPGARGRNVARSIRDDEERDRLTEIAHVGMEGAEEDMGLILRSVAAGTDEAAILEEIAELRSTAEAVLAEAGGREPILLMDAPSAGYQAWRDWAEPDPDAVYEGDGSFEEHGIFDLLDLATSARVSLGPDAFMFVEATRALVAVDVNTGGDFSFAAGLKANLAAIRALPRALRLKGLGGQIVVDLAPMGKKDRRTLEQALTRALKTDPVETAFVGWTPLGHIELQRKRERLPMAGQLATLID